MLPFTTVVWSYAECGCESFLLIHVLRESSCFFFLWLCMFTLHFSFPPSEWASAVWKMKQTSRSDDDSTSKITRTGNGGLLCRHGNSEGRFQRNKIKPKEEKEMFGTRERTEEKKKEDHISFLIWLHVKLIVLVTNGRRPDVLGWNAVSEKLHC